MSVAEEKTLVLRVYGRCQVRRCGKAPSPADVFASRPGASKGVSGSSHAIFWRGAVHAGMRERVRAEHPLAVRGRGVVQQLIGCEHLQGQAGDRTSRQIAVQIGQTVSSASPCGSSRARLMSSSRYCSFASRAMAVSFERRNKEQIYARFLLEM